MNESRIDTATTISHNGAERRNKELVRRYFAEVWNAGDESASDALIAEEYVGHTLIHGSSDHSGIAGHAQWIGNLRKAFPDLNITIEDIIAEGDKIVARVILTGTHRGEFGRFAPSNKHAVSDNVFIVRIADGRIVEKWISFDAASFWKQLGVE